MATIGGPLVAARCSAVSIRAGQVSMVMSLARSGGLGVSVECAAVVFTLRSTLSTDSWSVRYPY